MSTVLPIFCGWLAGTFGTLLCGYLWGDAGQAAFFTLLIGLAIGIAIGNSRE